MYTPSLSWVAIVSLAVVAVPALGQSVLPSIKSGVYTESQAKRGEGISGEECARCHSISLLGGENDTPPLVGDEFQNRWNGATLGDLFEKMRTTMPTDSPGRLSKSDYIDVLAFVLSSNQYPAGKTDLKPDMKSLKQIKIEP